MVALTMLTQDFYDQLEQILITDPGARGVASLLCPGDLARSCAQLKSANRLGIITGFPVGAALACETDGPLGALELALAWQRLERTATIVCDQFSRSLFEVLQTQLRIPFELVDWREFRIDQVDHLVAIERVGPAMDGICYAMSGDAVTDQYYSLESCFEAARAAGINTTGIGDGGNEIGMGKLNPEAIEQSIAHGARIACRVPTDHLIVAGISNWGVWGVLAGLTVELKRSLLPDRELEQLLLREMIECGAIDGRTLQSTESVDGFTLDQQQPIRMQIEELIREYC